MSPNPDHYKHSINYDPPKDIEELMANKNKRNIHKIKDKELLTQLITEIINDSISTQKELDNFLKAKRRGPDKLKLNPKKSDLLYTYKELVANKKISYNSDIITLFKKKKAKSESGVLVITIITSPFPMTAENNKDGKEKPQKFSCKWNCYYCPNEPKQPRSYLHDEPAVLRANQNNFDPILQFASRAYDLSMMGHPIDKIEILVLGGTWASYPKDYRRNFIRDIYYAANTFSMISDKDRRIKSSLEEEILLNKKSSHKIIGLTLETRPDCINPEEIKLFRMYGCTRVQLGVQHTDDIILKKINRECTIQDAKDAIKLLKNNAFKVDIHIMPNLPGATPEKDYKMFNEILSNPDLQADQWKIYPCEIVPWTIIKKWYEEGKYKPYSEEELYKLLIEVKSKVHPWIRLNRVIRDIPSQYVLGNGNIPNMRQYLAIKMKEQGLTCKCIRCREIGLCKDAIKKKNTIQNAILVIRVYEASDGVEYFISYESPDKSLICGFCRLRLCNSSKSIFPELNDCALIRELHVYGNLIKTTNKTEKDAQHIGFGKKLLKIAEQIALQNDYTKIAVISGVGAQYYYRKNGYVLLDGEGEYMGKNLVNNRYIELIIIYYIIILLFIIFKFLII